MNNVVNFASETELLPILKPLIYKILAEENLANNSSNTHNSKALVPNQEANINIRAKELELIERVIRLEEQSNTIREDVKNLRQDMNKQFTEIRQDMDKRFNKVYEDMKEIRQDMDKRFNKVYEDMKEIRQDMKESREEMNKRFDKQTTIITSVFGIGFTFLTSLITIFYFLK